MGTKTIGLDEEAYERLRAEKREDESFSDVVKRVTSAVHSDWRRGYGKYGGEEGERLGTVALDSRSRRGSGQAGRQRDAIDALQGEAPGSDDAQTDASDSGSERS